MVAVTPDDASHPVLLFDGICNLCNWSVQFTMKRDVRGHIHFASLQSKVGKQLLSMYESSRPLDARGWTLKSPATGKEGNGGEEGTDAADVSLAPAFASVTFIEDGRMYTESTAVLRILRHLKMPWPLLSAFQIIPVPLRDGMYRFIAKHRYRWFGIREVCMVPSSDTLLRFLDREENDDSEAKSMQ